MLLLLTCQGSVAITGAQITPGWMFRGTLLPLLFRWFGNTGKCNSFGWDISLSHIPSELCFASYWPLEKYYSYPDPVTGRTLFILFSHATKWYTDVWSSGFLHNICLLLLIEQQSWNEYELYLRPYVLSGLHSNETEGIQQGRQFLFTVLFLADQCN